ncbi:MAG: hypothetical protein HZB16_06205 [Armatimonadetes bacterium]|nr:hypothetical protein [Armatimonadota bacterium]
MVQRTPAMLLLAILTLGSACAQVGGNSGYSQSNAKARAESREQALRSVAKDDLPPSATGTYVEASVMLNQPADAYVAVFSVATEGATPALCAAGSEATIEALATEFGPLGVAASDLAVDWVAQARLYAYELQGDILQEKLTGFELRQNVAVPYHDAALLPKLALAAARAQVFDLVKVDYVVQDLERVRDLLMESASAVVKGKLARYERLLGITYQLPPQVIVERSAVHCPTQLYDSYTAQESETVRSGADRQRYTVRGARKSTTFFYNGLDADGYDAVINPVVTAPCVQFTLYLRLRYEAAPKAP